VSGRVEAVLPYWLDRPDDEALEIAAVAAHDAGLETLWIGEMATFDAIALAAAIGHRAPGLSLKIGPLAIGVRSPAAVAFGTASVAALTGCRVDVALGASSPAIVAGWHGRDWAHSAPRMRETVECLRGIFSGAPSDYQGTYVRSHGFRLRTPLPGTRISVAAFGPAMTRVAARHADEVVLNLVTPEHVAGVRATVDAEAAAAGRTPPALAVWVPVALDPGKAARAQMAGQIAVYLAPPGYGEMFSALGFGELVQRARAGARRAELAADIPDALLERIGAVGDADTVVARIRAYYDAGADVVGAVPSTAEDPGGRCVLRTLAARSHVSSATGAGLPRK
jgi:probable F420-dependent oxidoreductase